MFSKSILAGAIAATFVALPAVAAVTPVNLVQNGDFETTTYTGGGNGNFEFDSAYAAGSGKVSNWTGTYYALLFHTDAANSQNTAAGNAATIWGNQEYLRGSTASPTGGNFVAIDGAADARSTLSQTITGLTVGQAYDLSFNWAGSQVASRTGGPLTEQLQVTFGNSTFNTNTLTYGDNSASGALFTGWNTASTRFTATSTSQVLSFLSVGTPTGLPPIALLDSVKLTAAVPEPASWAMMIGGFGMVGGALRRSRRTQVAFA